MYAWTQKYVGIPFLSGGRNEGGVDCYGLVRLILNNEYGYNLPLLSNTYDNALDVCETGSLFQKYVPLLCGEKISKPEEKAVALLKMRGLPSHVALYAGDDFIIHAMSKNGVACERLSRPLLKSMIEGWYRVDKNNCAS